MKDVNEPTNDELRITFTDGPPSYKKKPLSPHLFVPHEYTSVEDVLVQTGYPIWNLIAQWIGAHYNDEAVLAAYSDMSREEWEAAKQYYLDHQIIFDAKLITMNQPYADEDIPPLRTVAEYFTWLDQDKGDQDSTSRPLSASGTAEVEEAAETHS